MSIFAQHYHVKKSQQRGAVSLFIVIFAAMLMTILTISFVRIMMHDQLQATNNDLSQSAHDSALAGIEDAKRALVACQNGDASICTIIDKKSCTTLSDAGIVPGVTKDGNREMPIQTLTTDDTATQLDQAYTCVTISRVTDDYVGQLQAGQSKLIPLKGVSAFDTVQLSWFQYDDFKTAAPSSNQALSYFRATTPYYLPSMDSNSWPQNSPSLMRAQLMQYANTGFKLDDLSSGSDANTAFLYPLGATTPSNSAYDMASAGRGAPTSPHPVYCAKQLSAGGYACTLNLKLPAPGNGSINNRIAYLRLSSLYNPAHYQIKLLNNGSSLVQIDGEQPIVDSTARANDVFRRVEGRVEMTSDFPYPDAGVDITGSLCKNFVVTDDPSVASTSNICTP